MTTFRSHKVAAAAFEKVKARKGSNVEKEYGALTHKLPGMILQNGIAQATGFLLAKGKEEHKAVLDDLLDVLKSGGTTQAADRGAFHGEILAADLAKTMKLTRHALDASAWMKRYVQGELGITATGDTAAEVKAEAEGATPAAEGEGGQ